jgi:hypothetical protein
MQTPLVVYVRTWIGGFDLYHSYILISHLYHRCVMLLPPPDDVTFLRTIHKIYLRFSKFPEALGVAIRLNDPNLIREDFNASGNP